MSANIIVTGRLVGGHPMDMRQEIDDITKQPKMMRDGITPLTGVYIGVAVPKAGEQHWNQTRWGADIYNAGVAAWPAGQHGAPTFAWKVTDGDSTVPNKKGHTPASREGYPGHWVLHFKNFIPVKCYHAGRYQDIDMIQTQNEIKTGDYCRVLGSIKGNGSDTSPGVYLNPNKFELSRAGVAIITDSGPSATEAFGAAAAVLPQNGAYDMGVAAVAQALPGALPGQVPGAIPALPGAIPALPGAIPALPGALPGQVLALPGQVPGAIPALPGAIPALPGALPGQVPGAIPALPGAIPAFPGALPGAVPALPAQPQAPAMDYLAPATPEVKYQTPDGTAWTQVQLTTAGFTPEMIAALPRV